AQRCALLRQPVILQLRLDRRGMAGLRGDREIVGGEPQAANMGRLVRGESRTDERQNQKSAGKERAAQSWQAVHRGDPRLGVLLRACAAASSLRRRQALKRPKKYCPLFGVNS